MNTIHPTRLVQTYEVVEIVEIDAARLLTLGPSLLQDSSTVTPVALLDIPNGSPARILH